MPKRLKAEAEPLRAARVQIEEARDKLNTACKMLRMDRNGEIADELAKINAQLKVWVQPDGWLDIIERQIE